jgi:hypothetical protein
MAKYYSIEEREALHPENFGDPDTRTFLILSQEDIDKAPGRVRRLDGREELKKNIIEIANRKGFKIPNEWATDVVIDKPPANTEINTE